MANREHVKILKKGVEAWNNWRQENPKIIPNLKNKKLTRAKLSRANLQRANLGMADLREANLTLADLHGANLRKANFVDANLSDADLSKADLTEADFSGANVYWANLSQANVCGTELSWVNLLRADLSKANISKANFTGSNLGNANLSEAKIFGANFSRVNLSHANLSGASINKVDLSYANLVEAVFNEAALSDCSIYGSSVWRVKLDRIKEQNNLRVTPNDEPAVYVDNLEVAQFVYLLLHNQKIRSVIDTIGEKGVLILGRFTPERKAVLEAIRNRLRELGFVPMMFDFEKPKQRDFTETIKTLAGLSRFIIADITNPKSAPLELQATMPDYMIQFVPIIHENEEPFAMFRDLKQKYGEWVLDVLEYDSAEGLVNVLDEAVVQPALEKAYELIDRKAEDLKKRHVKDYKKKPGIR